MNSVVPVPESSSRHERRSSMSNANAAHGDHSKSGWLHTSPGERLRTLTPASETDGAYTLLEVLADPQYGVPMHIHDSENEHFMVLEGTAHRQ